MIYITENKNGFRVEGHADYDEHGKDIVCAGVSALAQAVARVLQVSFGASVITKPGYLEVIVYNFNDMRKRSVDVENVFWFGVFELESQYPNHITIRRI